MGVGISHFQLYREKSSSAVASDGNAAIERAPVAALQQKIMQYLTPSRGSGRVETE